MTFEEFMGSKGKSIGTSSWLKITQADIDGFGKYSHDIEPMHNNPQWCEENSPFGKTIAYGFQTISLLTYFMSSATNSLFEGTESDLNFPLNYGFNRLRLINPVKIDDRIRAHFFLVDYEEKSAGKLLSTLEVTVEIEGKEKPALKCEWLVYWISGDDRNEISTK
jgi:acyl dehydratase